MSIRHISVIKRLRQNKKCRLLNRYNYKSAKTKLKNLLKKVREKNISKEDKENIIIYKNKVISSFDKLVKKNIIHKNKSSKIKKRISFIMSSI